SFEQIRFRILARKKIFGSSVEFEGSDVACGGLLNSSLFAWRKTGLQLVGNRGRDLTLNRKYISNVAVVTLPPEPAICGHINQLGVDAHPIARSLHGSFHHARNA